MINIVQPHSGLWLCFVPTTGFTGGYSHSVLSGHVVSVKHYLQGVQIYIIGRKVIFLQWKCFLYDEVDYPIYSGNSGLGGKLIDKYRIG